MTNDHYVCEWCHEPISEEEEKAINNNPVWKASAKANQMALRCDRCESKYDSCDMCGEPIPKEIANPENKPHGMIFIQCDKCKAGHFMCYVDKGGLR